MDFESKYIAHKADADGIVDYSGEENQTWHALYQRQIKTVQGRACQAYLNGLDILDMTPTRIPQCPEMSATLHRATGWVIEPVAALIDYDTFFALLANRHFPAATFIRRRDELDYLTEPDIFHEFFGHCPMLTEPVYADFMQEYGRVGQRANKKDQTLLARLYWFTVEFGLINTPNGPLSYGGGILSSFKETVYAVASDIPERKPFDIIDVLRTPYRIDILQPIYFVIDNSQQLYDVLRNDIFAKLEKARELGEFAPTFPPKGSP